MSDQEVNQDAPVAEIADDNPMQQPVNEVGFDSGPSSNGNMGMRLGIIFAVFAILAGGIWGVQLYLKAQIPKPGDVERPVYGEDADVGGVKGGQAVAPPA